MIVSNPPYISDDEFLRLSDDVAKYEPSLALRGGAEGIALHREIIAGALNHLEAGGHLVMEIGAAQRQRLEGLIAETGAYENISCRRDYAGLDRVIMARRTETWTR
jgi:release factor glutamine methyltransferase